MIRIELGREGLGRTRFALSPLNVAADLLHALRRNPQSVDRPWQARAGEALRTRRLCLLAVLGGGGPHGYAPDFMRPQPPAFHTSVDSALHQVATTSTERIRYELTLALGGHSWDDTPAGRPPRLLLEALQRGEKHLAQRIADEMAQFWQLAFEPHWPRLQTRLEDDIAARGTAIARNGLTHAINQLSPAITWRDGGLDIHTYGPHQLNIDADAVILVPCPVLPWALFCGGDPDDTPDPRAPWICYPSLMPASTSPSLSEELIGNTRARLLAELARPRTTGELAQRLHLSRATVSYHLQILHRAGLLDRSHHSRHVFYALASGADGQPAGVSSPKRST
ncbi:winged helix-turn-helix domain-containing protein [Streptomyces sp. NPDC001817]|uniref:ArsR/SmtB family transcription factor n=1 Tax=Streptomyces sp. NPDC001817 TaxID=3154398 RepID=UPI00332845F1